MYNYILLVISYYRQRESILQHIYIQYIKYVFGQCIDGDDDDDDYHYGDKGGDDDDDDERMLIMVMMMMMTMSMILYIYSL